MHAPVVPASAASVVIWHQSPAEHSEVDAQSWLSPNAQESSQSWLVTPLATRRQHTWPPPQFWPLEHCLIAVLPAHEACAAQHASTPPSALAPSSEGVGSQQNGWADVQEVDPQAIG